MDARTDRDEGHGAAVAGAGGRRMGVLNSLSFGGWSRILVAASMAAAPPMVLAQVPADLCSTVRGLCAARHFANMAELKTAMGPEIARLISQAEADAASSPIFRLADPGLSAAAAMRLRDSQVKDAGPLAIPGSTGRVGEGPAKPAPDPGRFGRPEAGDPMQRGLGNVTPERNKVGGTAGRAQEGLRPGMPDRGSLTRQGGTTPGTPGPGTLLDPGSAPNGHGGVTWTTTGADGVVKVVETGGTRQGGSYQQVDLYRRGGDHTRISTVFSPTGMYAFQVHAHRQSSTDLYSIETSHSNAWGTPGSWVGHGDLQRHHTPNPIGVGPNFPPASNVDPDAPGRSRQPPVCAFANPDCDMPLMVRFHNDRPDRRGRPDENAGQGVPRLNTDRHGNVVNPGLEPAAGGSVAPSGRAARSIDGGRLSNPADQRGGTGSGGEGSRGGGPPKPP